MNRHHRKSLQDIHRTNYTPEGHDKRSDGYLATKDFREKQTVSERSQFNTAGVNKDQHLRVRRYSPQPGVRHRRSRELTGASSQESFNNMAGTGMGRDSVNSSSSDTRDEGRKSPESNLRGHRPTIEEEPDDAANITVDSSPTSTQSLDRMDDTCSRHTESITDNSEGISIDSATHGDRSPDKKDPYSDGLQLSGRHTRERSFERSLDNIMDKCSEKSLDLNLSVESWNGSVSDASCKSPDSNSNANAAKYVKSEKKKKTAWYAMLAPSYKTKSEDFRKIFKDIPHDERLIVDYSCALQKDILVQGRMYITQNWVCFYANIFRWETVLTIQCKEITAVTKERTARVIPNAIQITTDKEKYFFTSLGARDKTFMMLFRIWQNALMDQPMNSKELWQWIHYSYGEELGLTSSDDDYVPPPGMDDLRERLSKEDASPQKDQTDSSDVHLHGDPSQLPGNDDTDVLVSDEVFRQSPSPMENSIGGQRSEIPTDFGDTTEDSEGEVVCTGHNHLEKLYLDEVFNLSVDKVFEYLFTDSAFFRQFVGSRKTFALNLPPWQDELDGEGSRIRNISYTLSLNQTIGPKTSPSSEKQICYKQSEPGVMYLVDTECSMGGIPYADNFYVVNRYCLTRVSKTKCRVRVTSEVRYRKSVMGLVKSMIDRSALSGLTDNFRSLSVHLRREAERQETVAIQPSKKKLRKRRKMVGSGSETLTSAGQIDRQTSTPPSPLKSMLSLREDKLIKLNADTLIRIICVILILLVMFNALLFYKLWSLESYANALYFPHSEEVLDNLEKYPRSQEEWVSLIKQQQVLHDSEIDKWQEVLSASILLIDQMKGTLVHLHNSLEGRLKERHKTAAESVKTQS